MLKWTRDEYGWECTDSNGREWGYIKPKNAKGYLMSHVLAKRGKYYPTLPEAKAGLKSLHSKLSEEQKFTGSVKKYKEVERNPFNSDDYKLNDPVGSNEGFRADLYKGMSAAARKHGFDQIDAVQKAIAFSLEKIGRAVRVKNKVSSWRK